MMEKTLESLLEIKEIKPVNPKGNQCWIFFGRPDAEAETPVIWPPDVKNWLIGKDPEAGKDWRQVEKGIAEDERAGWHYRLNGHDFGHTPWYSGGQGRLTFFIGSQIIGHESGTEQQQCVLHCLFSFEHHQGITVFCRLICNQHYYSL